MSEKKAPLSYSAALSGVRDNASSASKPTSSSSSSPHAPSSSSSVPQTSSLSKPHPPPNAARSSQQPLANPSLSPSHRNPNQNRPRSSPSRNQNQTHGNKSSNNGAYTAQTYTRNPDHVARTSTSSSETSYILSLLTSRPHHAAVTALRAQHFPRALNKLSAHVALFRALPGSELPRITSDLEALATRTAPFPLVAEAQPFRLRHGIGINVGKGGKESKAVYEELRKGWRGFLSKQDDGGFRAHYTVMNKVDDEAVVEAAMEEIQRTWDGDEGVVEGLALWRYDRGYWRLEKEFKFEGN